MGLFNKLKESIDQAREQVKQEFEDAKQQFKQAYEEALTKDGSDATAKPVEKPTPVTTVKPEEKPAEPAASSGDGVFSQRLEALIESAIQDGVLTEQERAVILNRAQKEGEDPDEVEIIINARLTDIQQKKGINKVPAAPEDQVSKPKSHTEQYLETLNANIQKAQTQQQKSIVKEGFDWSDLKNKTHVEIPEGITEIPSDKFSRENLESITLPSTLVVINNSGFGYCEKLTVVDLSNCVHLEKIDAWAFRGCYNLERVIFPCSLQSIDEYCFYECKKLAFVDFSRCTRLEKLGKAAFYRCESLSNVSLPDSLITIGEDCFYTTGLERIVIPDSVEQIGPGAFGDNPHLSAATIGQSASGYAYHNTNDSFVLQNLKYGRSIFVNTPELKELTFRSKIAEYTGAKTLTNVFFANTVKEIGFWALCEYKELEEVIIPDSVTKIGYGAFAGCESLASAIIPDSVTEIAVGAFSGTAVKELVFPSELRELGRLGENLFKLRKLDFSKVRKLEVIPEAFLGDSPKVKELALPMGVKEIEEEIGGESLSKLFLPPTIERVDDLGQINLNIYCYAPKIEELGLMVEGLDDPENACHLFVLPEYLEDYKAQLEAEDIEEGILTIDVIPEELRYYYDN